MGTEARGQAKAQGWQAEAKGQRPVWQRPAGRFERRTLGGYPAEASGQRPAGKGQSWWAEASGQ